MPRISTPWKRLLTHPHHLRPAYPQPALKANRLKQPTPRWGTLRRRYLPRQKLYMIRSLFNVHTGRSCVSNFVNSVQERPELSISYSTNQWQLRLPNRNAKWKPWVCELKLLIGSLATNYIRAVSEIPDPALQVKSTNRNYALPAPAGRIYRQVPTIIGHINAADLPLPPRPLAGKYAGQTFSTPNDPSLARRPPSILSLSRPWDPFLTASPIP